MKVTYYNKQINEYTLLFHAFDPKTKQNKDYIVSKHKFGM